ncbi:MAG: uracil-DNA glycosylase [Spirochaetaceae bacterium]|nr:uracil-DNA glycosylase [Spirochaetaceae bacterium]
MRKVLSDLWNVLEDYRQLVNYGYKCDNREYYVPETITNTPGPRSVTPAQVETGSAGAEQAQENEPDSFEKITKEIMQCTKCKLCKERKNSVPGTGVLSPLVMVIGEGPGAEEDSQGLPFVGAAGQYLDKWLNAISLDRATNCFIGNIVKCRPPGNRDPQPDEAEQCIVFLKRQIALLKPRAILTVGRVASSIITAQEGGIGKLRGKIYNYEGIPVVVTYHPSAVLRDRSYRAAVWDDLRELRKILDEIT